MQPLVVPGGVGRFAPSPSGPLHLGSLVAALASYLHARSRGRTWVLRMDDLDPGRQLAGAATAILRALEGFGLEWDGPVLYQSARKPAYRKGIADLRRCGLLFPCGCNRKEVSQGPTGEEGPIYPGTCRWGLPPGRKERSLRLRVDDHAVAFADNIQGVVRQNLACAVGDFVVRRADGGYAYQLAVVIDDAWQGITEVVRGADLLASTPRQLWLQHKLGLAAPDYWHIPVLVDTSGRKLSKSRGSAALDPAQPVPDLVGALAMLGQAPPAGLADNGRDAVLSWALQNWDIANVPRAPTLVYRGEDQLTAG